MKHRVLLALAHDVSYHSVSCMLGAEEALQEDGWECAIWANPDHINRLPERKGPMFMAPRLDSSALWRSNYPITSCDDLFGALGLITADAVWQSLNSVYSAIHEFRPSCVIADLCPIAMIAARHCGIPSVATLRWAYHPKNPENLRHTHPDAVATREAFNTVCDGYSWRRINVVSELVLAGAVRYVIPSIPPFESGLLGQPEERLGIWAGPSFANCLELGLIPGATSRNQRRLYVYWDTAFMTLNDQCSLLAKAISDTGWQALVAAPPGVLIPQTPPFVLVQISPPGRSLLLWSHIFVTHGGSASLLQAAQLGRPVVVTPGDSVERQKNAEALCQLGWGVVVQDEPLLPVVLRDACEKAICHKGNDEGRRWQQVLQESLGAKAFPEVLATLS